MASIEIVAIEVTNHFLAVGKFIGLAGSLGAKSTIRYGC